jgi:hypothetical protein
MMDISRLPPLGSTRIGSWAAPIAAGEPSTAGCAVRLTPSTVDTGSGGE